MHTRPTPTLGPHAPLLPTHPSLRFQPSKASVDDDVEVGQTPGVPTGGSFNRPFNPSRRVVAGSLAASAALLLLCAATLGAQGESGTHPDKQRVAVTSRLGSDLDAVRAAWTPPPAAATLGAAPGGQGANDDSEAPPFYQYTLVTHVLTMSTGTRADRERTRYIRKWLSGENRMDFVDLDRYLEVTPGVRADEWPAKFHDAEYAVRDLERELAASRDGVRGKGLEALYYINALQWARENNKTLTDNFKHVSHALGCLLGHMYQWQYAWDKKYEDTVVLESDAPNLISVPPFSFQDIVNHQPFDYDIIFLTLPHVEPGDYLYSFHSHGPKRDEMIHMYRWNTVKHRAGIQAYVMSRRFKFKVIKFVASSGGMDMVDAWLMTEVCSKRQPDTGKYALNCYYATTVPPADAAVVMRDADKRTERGGFVRLGRYEFNTYPEDSPVPYDFGYKGEVK